MRPLLIPRQCGGWLAAPPPSVTIRLGVTAETESEAVRKYDALHKKVAAEMVEARSSEVGNHEQNT